MNKGDLPKLALIAGPTASGKSALAVAVAERFRGVVINADSSQVYADLRVISARPSVQDEARAPHRLFGYLSGNDVSSAARWAQDATTVIAEVIESGRLPVLVGGTGLYVRSLLDGIAPVPAIDPAVRAEVRGMATETAYIRLKQIDPLVTAKLNPGDTTRIARALEVMLSTGRSIVEWQAERSGGIGETISLAPLILLPPRDWLFARCDRRAAMMLEEGGVEEVRRLLALPYPADAPVRRAIGVREIGAMLCGEMTRVEALAALQLATRQYAKRQYTWFRNQPPAHWLRSEATETCTLLRIFDGLLR